MNITIKCSDASIEGHGYRGGLSVELTGVDTDSLDNLDIAKIISIDNFIKAYKVQEILECISGDDILNQFSAEDLLAYLGDDVIVAAARKIKIANLDE